LRRKQIGYCDNVMDMRDDTDDAMTPLRGTAVVRYAMLAASLRRDGSGALLGHTDG
jgi:hypothetical protein